MPTLLIDPKGDLTNLCLTFPTLAPNDFEPWVNAGDAQKAGKSVAGFAAAQAAAWTDGLAGWGITAEHVATLRQKAGFTIYTPGSTGGVGLNIVGSLAAPIGVTDPEILGDEIDGFVSGLLGLVGVDADPLTRARRTDGNGAPRARSSGNIPPVGDHRFGMISSCRPTRWATRDFRPLLCDHS